MLADLIIYLVQKHPVNPMVILVRVCTIVIGTSDFKCGRSDSSNSGSVRDMGEVGFEV